MWSDIFVEEDLLTHPRAQQILAHFPQINPIPIKNYEQIWGRFKKPYLHKRTNLNLYLARKKGQLIKETPDAYGLGRGKHYYFIHAYNCIYECQYCYLQGYFETPDLVLFVNHEDILEEMKSILKQHPDQEIWFHAGEYSDSLALSHITEELPLYFDFFKNHPNAKLELRTKSVNIKALKNLEALPNVIVSFSLSASDTARDIDLKAPSIKARLMAMSELKKLGFKLGLHLDPIILSESFPENYFALIDELHTLELLDFEYISLGVVRFTSDVYQEVEKNYPESLIHASPMIKSFDQKVRYHRPQRMWMLSQIKEKLLSLSVPTEKIYLCMEEHETT